MKKFAIRLGWTCAASCLLLSVGCQDARSNKEPRTAPGALPSLSTIDRVSTPSETSPKLNASTVFAHAHLLERQGNFERAAEQYEKCLEMQPEFIGARNRLGVTLNKLGRHAEATRQLQLCVNAQPQSAFLHNNLGFSQFLENDLTAADASLRRAIELKPDFSRARMNYAVVLARLGRYDAAFDEFSRVCSQADAFYNVGILLTETGKYVEAARYLEGALAANPQFEAARKALNEVARLAATNEYSGTITQSSPTMLSAVETPARGTSTATLTGEDDDSQPIVPIGTSPSRTSSSTTGALRPTPTMTAGSTAQNTPSAASMNPAPTTVTPAAPAPSTLTTPATTTTPPTRSTATAQPAQPAQTTLTPTYSNSATSNAPSAIKASDATIVSDSRISHSATPNTNSGSNTGETTTATYMPTIPVTVSTNGTTGSSNSSSAKTATVSSTGAVMLTSASETPTKSTTPASTGTLTFPASPTAVTPSQSSQTTTSGVTPTSSAGTTTGGTTLLPTIPVTTTSTGTPAAPPSPTPAPAATTASPTKPVDSSAVTFPPAPTAPTPQRDSTTVLAPTIPVTTTGAKPTEEKPDPTKTESTNSPPPKKD